MLSGCEVQPRSGKSKDQQHELTPQEIYSMNCASCHGGNLQGGYGPSLSHVGSKLSKQDILAILHKGRGSMRPQLHLPQSDKEKIAEWLFGSK